MDAHELCYRQEGDNEEFPFKLSENPHNEFFFFFATFLVSIKLETFSYICSISETNIDQKFQAVLLTLLNTVDLALLLLILRLQRD